MLQYFVQNGAQLAEIVQNCLTPADTVYRLMEQIQVKRSATELLEVLNPIAEALNKLQSDTAKISDAIDISISLKEAIPERFEPNVKTRMDSALQPSMFAGKCAYMTL